MRDNLKLENRIFLCDLHAQCKGISLQHGGGIGCQVFDYELSDPIAADRNRGSNDKRITGRKEKTPNGSCVVLTRRRHHYFIVRHGSNGEE